jgi:hypothetical protein
VGLTSVDGVVEPVEAGVVSEVEATDSEVGTIVAVEGGFGVWVAGAIVGMEVGEE